MIIDPVCLTLRLCFADAAQAPRLHSVSITSQDCTASCTLSSLLRLARASAPALRHLVIGPGVQLSATDVSALATLRTLRSLKLHASALAGSSNEAAIAVGLRKEALPFIPVDW